MNELFNFVSYIIIETFKILKIVTTELCTNPIFSIILAIIDIILIFKIIFKFISMSRNTKEMTYTDYVVKQMPYNREKFKKQVQRDARDAYESVYGKKY